MKYAIIESGGKQYKAVEGGYIEVDILPVEAGQPVELDTVLLVADGEKVVVGSPVVAGARVVTTSMGQVKADKLVVFKYSPKKRIRVKTGHRQQYTRLKVVSIEME